MNTNVHHVFHLTILPKAAKTPDEMFFQISLIDDNVLFDLYGAFLGIQRRLTEWWWGWGGWHLQP